MLVPRSPGRSGALIDPFHLQSASQAHVRQPRADGRRAVADPYHRPFMLDGTQQVADAVDRLVDALQLLDSQQQAITQPRESRPRPGVDAERQQAHRSVPVGQTLRLLDPQFDLLDGATHPTGKIRFGDLLWRRQPDSLRLRERRVVGNLHAGDALAFHRFQQAVGQAEVRGSNDQCPHGAR